ncbi:hypothetical protein LEP3755_21350 [Leptolyngbya sp. NIES-3755]|nr:hypothetical protein LEP3755_21350 [Leptolyngbya sp. NIES-3755]
MVTFDLFKALKQKFASDSASWGSLLILALSTMLVVLFMVLYAHG